MWAAAGRGGAILLLVMGGTLFFAVLVTELFSERKEPIEVAFGSEGMRVIWRHQRSVTVRHGERAEVRPVTTRFLSRAFEVSAKDCQFRVFPTLVDIGGFLDALNTFSGSADGPASTGAEHRADEAHL
jgi:hypothetical protein